MLESINDIELHWHGVEIDGVFFATDEIKQILRGFERYDQGLKVVLILGSKIVSMDLAMLNDLRVYLSRVPMEKGSIKACRRCRVNPVPYRDLRRFPEDRRKKNLCIDCFEEARQIANRRVQSRVTSDMPSRFSFDIGRWYGLAYRFTCKVLPVEVRPTYLEWFQHLDDDFRKRWFNGVLPHEAVVFSFRYFMSPDFNEDEIPF